MSEEEKAVAAEWLLIGGGGGEGRGAFGSNVEVIAA